MKEAALGMLMLVAGGVVILRWTAVPATLVVGITATCVGGLMINISHLRHYSPSERRDEIRRLRSFPFLFTILHPSEFRIPASPTVPTHYKPGIPDFLSEIV
jgi:hypothetical protein